jgi:serine/threonine-protein kinase
MNHTLLTKDYIIKNRYRVLKILGQGGMGAVYLVKDHKEGGIWAAKEFWCFHEEISFSKEASLLMELSHIGLPVLIDCFTENNKNYLIMERIEGMTMEEIIEKKGILPVIEILPWIFQVCDILHYLHSQDPPIIYRDLKPSNIMLDIKGIIRLIDFGIARFFEPQKSKDTTPFGTPGYSPPEQYGRGQTSPASDIYSMGATLYFLLSGISPEEFRFKFPSLTKFNKNICPEIDNIVITCLETKPERRYQNVPELKRDLELCYMEDNRLDKKIKRWVSNVLSSNQDLRT